MFLEVLSIVLSIILNLVKHRQHVCQVESCGLQVVLCHPSLCFHPGAGVGVGVTEVINKLKIFPGLANSERVSTLSTLMILLTCRNDFVNKNL